MVRWLQLPNLHIGSPLVQISGPGQLVSLYSRLPTSDRGQTPLLVSPAWLDLRIGIKAVIPFWESDLIEVMKSTGHGRKALAI